MVRGDLQVISRRAAGADQALACSVKVREEMMASIIKPIPIKEWERSCNRRGRYSVSCVLSDRWLRFAARSDRLEFGPVVRVDVLTDAGDGRRTRRLCSLTITKEGLRQVLDRIDT